MTFLQRRVSEAKISLASFLTEIAGLIARAMRIQRQLGKALTRAAEKLLASTDVDIDRDRARSYFRHVTNVPADWEGER
jgi:hypothetical protein